MEKDFHAWIWASYWAIFAAGVLVQAVGYRSAVIVSGKYLSGISIFHTNLPEP